LRKTCYFIPVRTPNSGKPLDPFKRAGEISRFRSPPNQKVVTARDNHISAITAITATEPQIRAMIFSITLEASGRAAEQVAFGPQV
jgi:hypothetical protein